jgi:hypothetical protein
MPQRGLLPQAKRGGDSFPYFSEQNRGADDEFIIFLDAMPCEKLQGVTENPKTTAFRVGDSGKEEKACGASGW